MKHLIFRDYLFLSHQDQDGFTNYPIAYDEFNRPTKEKVFTTCIFACTDLTYKEIRILIDNKLKGIK